MHQLDFKIDKNGLLYYFVPVSPYSCDITLLINDTVIYHEKLDPVKSKHERWIGHPFLECYPNSEIKLFYNYFGHKNTIDTNLFYLHPEKCGGSSIEDVGLEYGIEWSRWVRPSYKYHLGYSDTIENRPELLKDKVLFTSVRNPYKRLISSVYCPYTVCHNKIENSNFSKDDFNRIIKIKINRLVPVYDFVYYNNKKVVPHVLKVENLNEEFNKLMFDYNCDIRMEKRSNIGSSFNNFDKFGIYDISPENIDLIHDKFENDFLYFDYEMIK